MLEGWFSVASAGSILMGVCQLEPPSPGRGGTVASDALRLALTVFFSLENKFLPSSRSMLHDAF